MAASGLWLLVAAPALRVAPPIMQQRDPSLPAGTAVPFAPLGSIGQCSTAGNTELETSGTFASQWPEQVNGQSSDPAPSTADPADAGQPNGDRPVGKVVPTTPASREVHPNVFTERTTSTSWLTGQSLPIGDRFSGGAVPFAPLGTAGGLTTSHGAAVSGRTGTYATRRAVNDQWEGGSVTPPAAPASPTVQSVAAPSTPQPAPQRAGSVAASAAVAGGAARAQATGSLVAKKNAIIQELGLSQGNLLAVAADASLLLGVVPDGKQAADLIDECHRKLFG